MPPDEGVPAEAGSTAESLNTDSTATSENIESGQASGSSRRSQELVARGINIGQGRMMEKIQQRFGVKTIEELDELFENNAQERLQPDDGNNEQEDISRNPKYLSVFKEKGILERKVSDLEREMSLLTKQADVARLEKFRSMALSHGVGSDGQVDHFVKVFGDRVKFDGNRELEVWKDDAPTGETVDEFIVRTLQENKFYLAPENRSGVGSRQQPTQDTSRAQKDDLYAWGLDSGPQSSKVDRFFSRRPNSETKK